MRLSACWLLPLLLVTSPLFAGDEQVTLDAMNVCRKESAALERLDCYDRF
jgi:type VI secretion system protein VasI